MLVGKQNFCWFVGLNFVGKQKMSQKNITLTSVLDLFTNYENSYFPSFLLGKITLFGLDATYKIDLSFLHKLQLRGSDTIAFESVGL